MTTAYHAIFALSVPWLWVYVAQREFFEGLYE